VSPRPPREDLWSFSLRLWRRPGVEQACLWLQERCGADVNLLLLCCWLASEGRPADARFLAGAAAAVAAWRAAAVEPLRRVRRRLADGVRGVPRAWRAPVRARALAAELEAERVEQLVLARRAARLLARAPRPGQAAANLDRYRKLLKTPPGGSVERRLAVLRTASEREGEARRAAG
jgi:uncharacterized protein (TIGR02444 family)